MVVFGYRPRRHDYAAWSPDGQPISFSVSARQDASQPKFLGYVNRYQSRTKVLLKGDVRDASWSPDGRSISFFMLVRPLYEPTVHVLDLQTHHYRRLRAGYHARWSPDGRRIVFVSRANRERILHIYVMNADGSAVRQLTQ